MKKLLPVIVVAIVVAAGFWFFPQRDLDRSSPLAFVPEDTPFVFAAADRAPQPVLDLMREQMRMMGPMYASQVRDARRLAETTGAGPWVGELLDALEAEFAGQTPLEVLDGLGIDLGGRFAFFGHRLVPVLRMELADPALLPAAVARVEARMGGPLPSAGLDDQTYWRVPVAELGVDVLAAVVEDHLVVSLAPADAGADVVGQLLGLQRPSRSLAASGGLRDMQRRLDYHGYFSGYLDTRRLVDAVDSEGSPAERAFMEAFGIPQPRLEPQCRGELDQLADAWPRLSFGYTRLDAERMDSRAVLEARADIAEDLMTLRAPMAGPAAGGDATRAEFGIAYRLSALPAVVNRHADAVRAQPWQCAQLQPLNEAFAQLRAQMANPALFMAAPLLDSVYVGVDSAEMPEPEAASPLPGVTGVLAIGSQNPASLLAMAQAFVPQLAAIGLTADGQPRPVPLAELGIDQPAQAVMGESVLALAVGDAAIARLPAALEVRGGPQPVLLFAIDSAFYAQMMELMVDATLASLDDVGMDGLGGDDPDASRQAAEVADEIEQARREMEQMAAILPLLFKRMQLSIELTGRGIEVVQQVEMP